MPTPTAKKKTAPAGPSARPGETGGTVYRLFSHRVRATFAPGGEGVFTVVRDARHGEKRGLLTPERARVIYRRLVEAGCVPPAERDGSEVIDREGADTVTSVIGGGTYTLRRRGAWVEVEKAGEGNAYFVTVSRSGDHRCTCPDSRFRDPAGGCKHVRAAVSAGLA